MTFRRLVVVGLAVALAACAAAAAVGAETASTGHARNPTIKERAGITAALPKPVQGAPVGCVYLRIRVSSDGRFARAEEIYLNPDASRCGLYESNGPDPILRKTSSRWKIIAYTSGSAGRTKCSLGIPRYLLVKSCRR